ncbi:MULTISPECIES: hypothetical protein [Brevibacterium]|uniref:Aminoglycoside phosphotransferase family protein n=2 Tax=Brevibacterium TaxID=1696 RepID=A0ABP9U998_9MICO
MTTLETTPPVPGHARGLGVPFVDELRSDSALSARLGFPVRPVRIRVKPGRSAIVAWQRLGGEGLAGWGWSAVMRDPDKLGNLDRRAARSGEALHRHAVGDGGFVLLSGGVRADPKLGRLIGRAARAIDIDTCAVVGCNPGRRVLLRHPGRTVMAAGADTADGGGGVELVRIGADSFDHMITASAWWRTRGLPTLPVTRLGGQATAVRTPWWGSGDLDRFPDRSLAEAVGGVIAELHAHSPTGLPAAGHDPSPLAMLAGAQRLLSRLLGEDDRLAGLVRRIGQRLEAADMLDGPRPVHGDLSPDQVLIGDGEIRIIDLDRAGVGSAGMDLGRWLAACRLRDDGNGRNLEEGFLSGYARAGGTSVSGGPAASVHDAWAAWALLVTAVEPWRTCRPDWQERTDRHLVLAEEALSGVPGRGGLRSAVPEPEAAVPIPRTVAVDGVDAQVRRAWPEKSGRIAFEAVADGRLRAGYLALGSDRNAPRVTVLREGVDPQLPGLAPLLSGTEPGRLISHRPGRRAVVALADGTFAKCVREGRTGTILAGQERSVAFAAGFTLPTVLDADASTVRLSRVPGVELHDPGRLGEHWERAWTDCLAAWAQAGSFPEQGPAASGDSHGPTSATTHSAADEARVLEDWRDRAAGPLGALTAGLDPFLAEVTAELREGAAVGADTTGIAASAADARGSWGPVHRDLHDKQLMWDAAAGPGLLDVDTACAGERELDLGNLCAHAVWRREQGIWSPAHADVVLTAIRATASANGFDPVRVRLYERATLLRLACVYAFRPQWAGRTGALLRAAR